MTTPDKKIVAGTFLCGVFTGYRPGTVFKLEDGDFWQQADNQFLHHHAVNPPAQIVEQDDILFLKVADIDVMVQVHRLHNVIESRINGKFTGWTGKTVYTLTNGQRWQQAKYMTKFLVKYMPAVLVYQGPSGPVMHVAGTTINVRQIG